MSYVAVAFATLFPRVRKTSKARFHGQIDSKVRRPTRARAFGHRSKSLAQGKELERLEVQAENPGACADPASTLYLGAAGAFPLLFAPYYFLRAGVISHSIRNRKLHLEIARMIIRWAARFKNNPMLSFAFEVVHNCRIRKL